VISFVPSILIRIMSAVHHERYWYFKKFGINPAMELYLSPKGRADLLYLNYGSNYYDTVKEEFVGTPVHISKNMEIPFELVNLSALDAQTHDQIQNYVVAEEGEPFILQPTKLDEHDAGLSALMKWKKQFTIM
jgi:hypothetical protein